MGFINPELVQGTRVARQVASAAASSVLATGLSSMQATPTSIPTTPTTPLTETPTSNSQTNNNSSSSSPLLFFVALGFGVVFTNIWIIVGVKYCFRYNARNRQLRMAEDGEPITMDNIQRPHRRRREKKLMTMDEVNKKFPMLKYKSWVANREQEGLPTTGGVSAPASRANSLRDVEGVISDLQSKEAESPDAQRTASGTARHSNKDSTSSTVHDQLAAVPQAQGRPTTAGSDANADSDVLPKVVSRASRDDEDDEDKDHINAAIPPECMGTSGDTCAICIDSLEDDDDVRGLTCGHAFHAVCLDPWLTSRRACCPLCKADYYTPKPRPQPTETGESPAGGVNVTLGGSDRHGRGINHPTRPPAILSLRNQTRRIIPGHLTSRRPEETSSRSPSDGNGAGFFNRFRQGQGGREARVQSDGDHAQPRGGFLSNMRSGVRGMLPSRTPNQSAGATATTEGQLEAGVRAS